MTRNTTGKRFIRTGSGVMFALLLAGQNPALAAPPVRTFHIPAQPLGRALTDLAAQSQVEIIAPADLVAGRQAPSIQGIYSPAVALRLLLEGSGLSAERIGDGFVVRGRPPAPGALGDGDALAADIIVTGTHIRGNEPAAPVIADSRAAIEKRGITDLGAYARSIPQNYSGGQNPGVISSLQEGSENINASSAMNLRGLGADATLTLLNGHRLPYDATFQGVDISAIPLAAIDRVEIVADGASALYGSDAVGGVANVILRRDYDGAKLSMRFGAATDGGSVQQQYGGVGGMRWDAGGFMIAGDFSKSTDITAGQRAITAPMDGSTTLYPPIRQWSGVVAGHQQLADGIIFELDGQLSRRTSRSNLAFLATGDFRTNGTSSDRKVKSWSIAPRLRIDLSEAWRISLRGTHGISDSDIATITSLGGAESSRNRISYENSLDAIELDAEGALFRLPGGDVRLAVGGGYRRIGLDAGIRSTRLGTTRTVLDYNDRQGVWFGYGEAFLPIVGPDNAGAFVHRLQLTGALRYEDYGGIGGTATPKLGIVYQPVEGFSLKGSWGRSFKAPTLAQQNRVAAGDLLPADFFIPAAPGGLSALLLSGGGPYLKPEKATTWTATASFEPPAIFGLRFEASYFHTNYRDRIAEPVVASDQVFGSPIYNQLIVYDPTADQIQAAIAGLPLGLTNQTGQPFDPASVGAIIDDRLQNVARQTLQGIDLALDYALELDAADRIRFSGNASYLESHQQLSPGQPVIARAGTIFDPPHWRGRGSISWEHGKFTLTGIGNYIGGTTDDRFEPATRVGSFISFDAIAQLATADESGPFAGIEVTLAILNLFNARPDIIRTSSDAQPPYDATNYPVIGRSVSLTISKAW